MQYQSRCNILTHSEMLYFQVYLYRKTSKNIDKYCIFILQRNLYEILIGYYTVLCTIWKDIVRVCIV